VIRLLRTVMPALLMALSSAATAERPLAVTDALAGFKGTVLVAQGDKVIWATPMSHPDCAQGPGDVTLCHPRNPNEVEWPWASVTKQVMATLVMQQVEAGRVALDRPVSAYLRELAGQATVPTARQLLQHRAGLRNPNDSAADAAGTPSFYTTGPNGLSWCLTRRTAPGGNWQYNNCDYIVLGAILERVTKSDVARLFTRNIARPLALKQARFVGRGDKAPSLVSGSVAELAPYGAAGALVGTPAELLKFDRALLGGKLLKPSTRTEMWKGDSALGYMALGQWSFEAKPKGCAAPVHIIERRGGIGRTQVRNVLLPEQDISVIMFLNDPDFDFGEIWQGKGLSHDVLAAAVCA